MGCIFCTPCGYKTLRGNRKKYAPEKVEEDMESMVHRLKTATRLLNTIRLSYLEVCDDARTKRCVESDVEETRQKIHDAVLSNLRCNLVEFEGHFVDPLKTDVEMTRSYSINNTTTNTTTTNSSFSITSALAFTEPMS